MAWDKTKPAGSQKIRLSDEEIRENNDCLEDALGRNHTFPGTKGSTAGEHTVIELVDQAGDLTQEAGMIKIWNNGGTLKVVYPGGSALPLASIPTNEIILFDKDTAVSGYTLQTDKDDYLAFITKGSAAGGQTGGADHSTGTWTQPDHALTEAEIPSHNHTYTRTDPSSFWYNPVGSANTRVSQSTQNTGSTGSGSAHNHGTTWRPKARCMTRQKRS